MTQIQSQVSGNVWYIKEMSLVHRKLWYRRKRSVPQERGPDMLFLHPQIWVHMLCAPRGMLSAYTSAAVMTTPIVIMSLSHPELLRS
jgi:hypothetical protein